MFGPGGGTRPENWWGCAAGRWKLDPKRSRKKLNLGPKRSIFVKIGSFCTPKDSFAVGGWEKVPQKDRARSCQSEKRGSKPRHICITHHIGSTPPPPPPPGFGHADLTRHWKGWTVILAWSWRWEGGWLVQDANRTSTCVVILMSILILHDTNVVNMINMVIFKYEPADYRYTDFVVVSLF